MPGLRSDRLAATLVGAVLVVALHVLTVREAQAAVDGSTLGLLFGMMVLSAALDVSGTFALLGWWLTRRARSPFGLLVAIAVGAAVLSAFLINDVVCVAFTPLVLEVTEAVGCDARPHLIALATASNIGSVATITGNPQNVLIGALSGIPYRHFALTMLPIAVLALLIDVAVIRAVFRDALRRSSPTRPALPRPGLDRRWVYKSSLVSLGVLVAFVAGVQPVVAALVGASLMLLTRAVDPQRLYSRINWSLLALFIGLFIVVAGFEKSPIAADALAGLERLGTGTVWGLTLVTAVLSNLVSNVPAVMLLKSMIVGLPDPHKAWLVLAMASTLAGNLTLPGSLATLIVVEHARGRAQVSLVDFLKVGFVVGIISLVGGATWLAVLSH